MTKLEKFLAEFTALIPSAKFVGSVSNMFYGVQKDNVATDIDVIVDNVEEVKKLKGFKVIHDIWTANNELSKGRRLYGKYKGRTLDIFEADKIKLKNSFDKKVPKFSVATLDSMLKVHQNLSKKRKKKSAEKSKQQLNVLKGFIKKNKA